MSAPGPAENGDQARRPGMGRKPAGSKAAGKKKSA